MLIPWRVMVFIIAHNGVFAMIPCCLDEAVRFGVPKRIMEATAVVSGRCGG